MIRPATHADNDIIGDMAYQMHKQSRFAVDYPFDHEKFYQLATTAIDQDQYCAFVSVDQDGTINGGMLGYVNAQFFSAAMVAQDIGVYVKPGARQGGIGRDLIKAFYLWACGAGAVDCEIGCNTGAAREGFAMLARDLKFNDVGDLYSKRCE